MKLRGYILNQKVIIREEDIDQHCEKQKSGLAQKLKCLQNLHNRPECEDLSWFIRSKDDH